MKKEIVNILGEQLEIAFNMAVEIAYEEIAGKAFNIRTVADSARERIALVTAAVMVNNPETSITMDDLLTRASAVELAGLTTAVFDAFARWCHIPDIAEPDTAAGQRQETPAEEEEKN